MGPLRHSPGSLEHTGPAPASFVQEVRSLWSKLQQYLVMMTWPLGSELCTLGVGYRG